MNEQAANATDWPASDWLGLGLDYGTVELTAARAEWGALAERLAAAIQNQLGTSVVRVEHVGSSAVPGLAAKPIIDLVAGLAGQVPLQDLIDALEEIGYQFRGDAGDQGGLVFVLEDRSRHRLVHLHVVDHGGAQWHRYLTFRDLLLNDPYARESYERIKRDLAQKFPRDRKAYTAAKQSPVRGLLDNADRSRRP